MYCLFQNIENPKLTLTFVKFNIHRNCIIVFINIYYTSKMKSNGESTRDEISKYANPNMNKQANNKTNKQTYK